MKQTKLETVFPLSRSSAFHRWGMNASVCGCSLYCRFFLYVVAVKRGPPEIVQVEIDAKGIWGGDNRVVHYNDCLVERDRLSEFVRRNVI